jgi:hypothetical protein
MRPPMTPPERPTRAEWEKYLHRYDAFGGK